MDLLEFVCLLKQQNEDSEVWWASSPDHYLAYKHVLIARYPDAARYIDRLMPEHFMGNELAISGATTTPRLMTQALLESAANWQDVLGTLDPRLAVTARANRLYELIAVQGAKLLQPLWTLSRHRYGRLSVQIEPAEMKSVKRAVERGRRLSRLAANVMVKVPGSETGYAAIEQLVARGCSINNTLCFSVSQMACCLAAIHNGRLQADLHGVNLKDAQYVVSFMIGRFGAEPEFDRQARRRGIVLSDSDKRWAELAIHQAMQALLRRWQTPARLLLCSLRVDTDANGHEQCWHLEKTGVDATLYSLTPEVIEFMVRRQGSGAPVLPAQDWLRVPDSVLNKLMSIPYFTQAYFDGAVLPADFERLTPFIQAHGDGRVAQAQLQAFVEGLHPRPWRAGLLGEVRQRPAATRAAGMNT